MNENRNLLVIFFFTVLVLWLYEYFFPTIVHQSEEKAAPTVQEGATDTHNSKLNIFSVESALRLSKRVHFSSDALDGSINLTGAVFDDVKLKEYKKSTDKDSSSVELLSPEQTIEPYSVSFGWVSGDPKNAVDVPGASTEWASNGSDLTKNSPLELKWKNSNGVVFLRKVSIDDQQMITVKDMVVNSSNKDINLYPYGMIVRKGDIKPNDTMLIHEGLVGVLDGKLKETDYKTLKEDKMKEYHSDGGWAGMTDKYWLVSLAVAGDKPITVRNRFRTQNNMDMYTTELIGNEHTITSGGQVEYTYKFFAGAKKVALLDKYEKEHDIKKFDLAVDFGYLYPITKPMFHVLTFLHDFIGNFGLAILMLTIIVKLLLFPMAKKSQTSMAAMKKLQPELELLKKKYPDDPAKRNQMMMELYKKQKVNPAAGCLPMLVQIPIFFSLYKVLYISIEMRHTPFFGWIHDLSSPDPTTLFNLFGLIPWAPPTFLMIGVWPLIMGLTMWLQQRLTPQPATIDPIMRKTMAFMPLFLVYIMAPFPAGLVIYWAWNNTLTIIQQWVLNRFSASKESK